MLQFAKIFETAGHQVLVRATRPVGMCQCGCRNLVPAYVVEFLSYVELRGQWANMVGIIQCHSPEEQLQILERTDKHHASVALDLLQQGYHRLITLQEVDEGFTTLKILLSA